MCANKFGLSFVFFSSDFFLIVFYTFLKCIFFQSDPRTISQDKLSSRSCSVDWLADWNIFVVFFFVAFTSNIILARCVQTVKWKYFILIHFVGVFNVQWYVSVCAGFVSNRKNYNKFNGNMVVVVVVCWWCLERSRLKSESLRKLKIGSSRIPLKFLRLFSDNFF
jgi:hypothetical protein